MAETSGQRVGIGSAGVWVLLWPLPVIPSLNPQPRLQITDLFSRPQPVGILNDFMFNLKFLYFCCLLGPTIRYAMNTAESKKSYLFYLFILSHITHLIIFLHHQKNLKLSASSHIITTVHFTTPHRCVGLHCWLLKRRITRNAWLRPIRWHTADKKTAGRTWLTHGIAHSPLVGRLTCGTMRCKITTSTALATLLIPAILHS